MDAAEELLGSGEGCLSPSRDEVKVKKGGSGEEVHVFFDAIVFIE